MRHLIGAGVLAAACLAATPGFAGVGQCVWEHLPQAERDRAFMAPSGQPLDYKQFADGLGTAIQDADLTAAATACGVDATKSDNNVTNAFAAYVVQHWAEHWLFLYPPHLSTAQLDHAYRAVDPTLIAQVGVDRGPNAGESPAFKAFEQGLGTIGELTTDAKIALGIYLTGRAGREAAEAAYGH